MRPDCKTEKDAPFLVILPFQKWPELELNLHIDALEAVTDELSTCMVTSGYPPLHSTMLMLVDNFLLFPRNRSHLEFSSTPFLNLAQERREEAVIGRLYRT